jgi:type II secretory pathway pseudopilin PulG
MTSRISRSADESGFTIVEVMVAIGVLLVGVLGTVTMLTTASATTERTQSRVAATNIAREVLETARTLKYDDVSPSKTLGGATDTSLIASLQAVRPTTNLQDVTAGGTWDISRRGVIYTIDVSACVVDDPKDGLAATHTPVGFYCPNLGGGSGDDNPDDYRRVTATVSWTRNGRTRSITQTGLIANPSGVLGPSVDFQGTVPNPTNPCPGTLRYDNIVTPNNATSVQWSVNDPAASHGTATDVTPSPNPNPGQKVWRVDWNMNPVYNSASNRTSAQDGDGPYTVTLIAFSPLPTGGGNVGGQPTFITQFINCSPPNPPTNFAGGYNWRLCSTAAGVPRYPICNAGERIIDFQWSASPDADVMGYRVFRVNGQPDYSAGSGDPQDTLVCPSVAGGTPLSNPATILGNTQYLERGLPTCKQDDPPNTGTVLTAAAYAALPNAGASLTAVNDSAAYYVQAVDPDPTDPSATTPRPTLVNHADISVTENELNMAPLIPNGVSTITASGNPCVRWGNGTDVTYQNVAMPNLPGLTSPVQFYRIYRDGQLAYTQRVARSAGGAAQGCAGTATQPNTFLDTAITSGSHTYSISAVDGEFLESFPLPTLTANWP